MPLLEKNVTQQSARAKLTSCITSQHMAAVTVSDKDRFYRKDGFLEKERVL